MHRSGHRLGDLGQAAEGLAIPREALLEDHDPLELAIPFSHQQRADLQADAVSRLRRAPVEGHRGAAVLVGAKRPLNRLVETAERVGLQSIGQAALPPLADNVVRSRDQLAGVAGRPVYQDGSVQDVWTFSEEPGGEDAKPALSFP